MRLLKIDMHGHLRLTKDFTKETPPYAILSHTWGEDEDEVTFEDLKKSSWTGKQGCAKIHFCGTQARKDALDYFGVDTCCINKANLTELSESITSMFRWYQNAEKCYVYLSDVTASRSDVGQTCPSRKYGRGESWLGTQDWSVAQRGEKGVL